MNYTRCDNLFSVPGLVDRIVSLVVCIKLSPNQCPA